MASDFTSYVRRRPAFPKHLTINDHNPSDLGPLFRACRHISPDYSTVRAQFLSVTCVLLVGRLLLYLAVLGVGCREPDDPRVLRHPLQWQPVLSLLADELTNQIACLGTHVLHRIENEQVERRGDDMVGGNE